MDAAKALPAEDLPEIFTLADLEAALTAEEMAAMQDYDPEMFDGQAKVEAVSEVEDIDPAEVVTAAAKAVKVEEYPQKEDAPAPVAVAEVPDTTEAEKIVAAFDAQLEALQGKYDDGDMTAAEFRTQMSAIAKAQAKAEAQIEVATQVITQNHAERNTAWMDSLNTFKAAGNEALWGDDHIKGFDEALKLVTANPSNADLSFPKMIALAAKTYGVTYEARTGKVLNLAAPKTPAPAADAPRREARKDPRPEPIETLSGLNGDGAEIMESSEFAYIDRMDPDDQVAAVAKMPADKRAAYLGGV